MSNKPAQFLGAKKSARPHAPLADRRVADHSNPSVPGTLNGETLTLGTAGLQRASTAKQPRSVSQETNLVLSAWRSSWARPSTQETDGLVLDQHGPELAQAASQLAAAQVE